MFAVLLQILDCINYESR